MSQHPTPTPTPDPAHLLRRTRRHFFRDCGVGVGKIALGGLLAQHLGANSLPEVVNPLAPKQPHFPPKVKNVIFLFMAGGPSHLDMFAYKPELDKWSGKEAPDSFLEGKRFAFMSSFTKEKPRLLGSQHKFHQRGQSGSWVSELLPHTSAIVDDITFLHAVHTENFNHAPAKIFLNTGATRFGRPAMGAWITYGLGSESKDLPGFVVLQSGPRGPRGGALNWGAGFLPTAYQGVPFQSAGDPILNLASPPGFDDLRQSETLATIRDLNLRHFQEVSDPEIATRIASYEMAYRMQSSGPELIDFSKESQATLDLYGAEPGKNSFSNNCLLARRLVERGVRFVQLYHTDWDHHGGKGFNLTDSLAARCTEIDQGCAALVKDLKQRGLLDETLIVWGGEFGRTPMAEVRENVGRNHHIEAYTMWIAGGGIKPGLNYGVSDEFGFSGVAQRTNVWDLQATILHLLGLEHKKLTFKFQGRDFRLTDVGGEVIKPILS